MKNNDSAKQYVKGEQTRQHILKKPGSTFWNVPKGSFWKKDIMMYQSEI